MERKQLSKEHSQTGDGRGRDKSGHGGKATEQGALTFWRWQRRASQDMERMQLSKGHSQTTWKREGQVRTQKECNQARGTHQLETAEGGTSQDMERKQLSKGHLHPGDSRGRDTSGHHKKATK